MTARLHDSKNNFTCNRVWNRNEKIADEKFFTTLAKLPSAKWNVLQNIREAKLLQKNPSVDAG